MESISLFPATLTLIAANVLASLYAWLNPAFLMANVFDIAAIRQKHEWHRLVTSGFLHLNTFHLLINMFVLFQFGAVVETTIGTMGFLIVYAAALLGGNLWALLENFRTPTYRALGASGAVSGVVFSFCLFAPLTLLWVFFILPLPAFVFAVLFIVISTILAQRENRMFGHEAHIGGALAGVLATIAVEPASLSYFASQVASFFGGG